MRSTQFFDRSNQRGKEEYNQCEGTTPWGRCTKNVIESQASYSKRFLDKVLCWDHQKKEKVSEK